MKATGRPSCRCPHCLRVPEEWPDVLPGTPDGAPRPGDLWLCFACGEVSVFGDDLDLARPDGVELVRLLLSDAWPRVVRARGELHAIRARGRAGQG